MVEDKFNYISLTRSVSSGNMEIEIPIFIEQDKISTEVDKDSNFLSQSLFEDKKLLLQEFSVFLRRKQTFHSKRD